jgi:hypothetical protein
MFVNLTGKDLTIENDEKAIKLPKEQNVAYCVGKTTSLGYVVINGLYVPVSLINWTVENLPAPQTDVYYIVNNNVAMLANRPDVLSFITKDLRKLNETVVEQFTAYTDNETVFEGVQEISDFVLTNPQYH